MRLTERAEHSFNKGCKVWEQVDYYHKWMISTIIW